ncbi:hypothetical protein ACHAW5_005844 [Stephanodiscus triporus]|uniref:PsbP C-terminal domain-containing protein n=1 Tax=Stephanodiscus triporus TaxID=2934178 RepID=A0ABD3N039_9STRA
MTTAKRIIIACVLLIASASVIAAFAPASPVVRPATRLSAADIDDVDEGRSGTTIVASGRRRAIRRLSAVAVAASSWSSSTLPLLVSPLRPTAYASAADAPAASSSGPYVRTSSPNDKFRFGYAVVPPPGFAPSNRPLRTHLDEINFSPPDGRGGYTLGITVDPVRISSIREFGTPEEVAARVVTAEVNRDGVFEVTLAKDPREDISAEGGGEGGGYDVEYVSDGKRGKKRFVTRIYVRDGFLYVLTVQSKEDEYDKAREAEVLECVRSFRPL